VTSVRCSAAEQCGALDVSRADALQLNRVGGAVDRGPRVTVFAFIGDGPESVVTLSGPFSASIYRQDVASGRVGSCASRPSNGTFGPATARSAQQRHVYPALAGHTPDHLGRQDVRWAVDGAGIREASRSVVHGARRRVGKKISGVRRQASGAGRQASGVRGAQVEKGECRCRWWRYPTWSYGGTGLGTGRRRRPRSSCRHTQSGQHSDSVHPEGAVVPT
jgi:hypothetical protein